MQPVTINDVEKLIDDPISFAMMMTDCEIQDVIATFVTILNRRKPFRGDQN